MLNTLRQIIEGTVERLQYYVTNFAPPLLAGLFVVLLSWAAALAVRWLIYKIFKGTAIDKFLRQSGVAFMLDRSGRLRATRIGAETAYWALLLGGVMLGLSIFDTNLTTQVINKVVFLLPKLVTAGLILLAGAWLSLYLSRSLLVWAVNETFRRHGAWQRACESSLCSFPSWLRQISWISPKPCFLRHSSFLLAAQF